MTRLHVHSQLSAVTIMILATAMFGVVSAFIVPRKPSSLNVASGLCQLQHLPSQWGNFCWQTRALRATTGSTTTEEAIAENEKNAAHKIGNVVILLPSEGASDSVLSKFGIKSPVSCPPVLDAAKQLARKTSHFSVGRIDTELVLVPKEEEEEEEEGEEKNNQLMQRLQTSVDVVIAFGLQSDWDLQFAEELFEKRRQNDESMGFRQCHFALDCAKKLAPIVGPHDPKSPSLLSIFPWTQAASAKRMEEQMKGLFDRWTTDDYAVAIMIFFNQFSGTQVDWVKHSIDATWEKGPIQNAQEFYAMINKCGDCIVKCVQDETCKECLDRLTEIDTRDQVASYRTIVSYESDLLRDFSFCILQKVSCTVCEERTIFHE